MFIPHDRIPYIGMVTCKIEYNDSDRMDCFTVKNAMLRAGKVAIVKCLANQQNSPFDFYVDKMIFGTNGTIAGVPRFVEEARTGLFGLTLLTKNAIASIDSSAPTSVIFTSVVAYDEGVGSSLNEMALKMKNGELYAMTTFPDLGKTSNMQLTWNWVVSYL